MRLLCSWSTTSDLPMQRTSQQHTSCTGVCRSAACKYLRCTLSTQTDLSHRCICPACMACKTWLLCSLGMCPWGKACMQCCQSCSRMCREGRRHTAESTVSKCMCPWGMLHTQSDQVHLHRYHSRSSYRRCCCSQLHMIPQHTTCTMLHQAAHCTYQQRKRGTQSTVRGWCMCPQRKECM